MLYLSIMIGRKVFLIVGTLNPFLLGQHFIKHSGNPVFAPINIIYEQRGIGSPAVILRNDTFHMLYASGSPDRKGYISYAFSTDGINWTRYNNGIPVFFPNTAGWDSFFLDTPEFLYHDSLKKFVMYYFGDTDGSPESSAIGIAISDDLKTWTRYSGNPVLGPGARNEWDGLFVESPSVAYAWGQYWMVYTGVDTLWRTRIGLAVSPDGFQWTKFPGNPIIKPEHPWESLGTATPTILFDGNSLKIWYCGASISDFLSDNQIDTLYVGLAYSFDGTTWLKDSSAPLLSTYDPPVDQRGPWAPDVVYVPDSGKYYMWYETATGFGFATAKAPVSHTLEIEPIIDSSVFIIQGHYLWISTSGRFYIFDVSGRLIEEIRTSKPQFVNLSHLSAGVYLMCNEAEGKLCRRFFVDK